MSRIDSIHYQMSTSNKSFINVYQYLKNSGVKNNKFFLAIYDTDLIKVDPYDPCLEWYVKSKIIKECQRNIWYFLREVLRIRIEETQLIPFELHLANLAQIMLHITNNNYIINGHRESFKDGTAEAIAFYNGNFKGINTGFLSKNKIHYKDIRSRFKIPPFSEYCPEFNILMMDYLKESYDFGLVEEFIKKNNIENIIIPDFEFIKNIDKIIQHLIRLDCKVAATSVICDDAKANGVYNLLDSSIEFGLQHYDHIDPYPYGLYHIQYDYKLLVDNPEEYLEYMKKILSDNEDFIRRELFLERLDRD